MFFYYNALKQGFLQQKFLQKYHSPVKERGSLFLKTFYGKQEFRDMFPNF